MYSCCMGSTLPGRGVVYTSGTSCPMPCCEFKALRRDVQECQLLVLMEVYVLRTRGTCLSWMHTVHLHM